MSIAFLVEPIRWQHFPLASGHPSCRAWLTFQSQRGLSRNTLEASSRGLEVFLRFLADQQLAISAVTRAHIGAYLAAMQGNSRTISNATLQQRVTVLRLFYGYLVAEKVCHKNPAFGDGGRMLVPRYRKLPWIPTETDWQSILSATRAEPIRNRAMLAFAYDAALRREELCGLRTDDIDPSHRMLRIRAENTKGAGIGLCRTRPPVATCFSITSIIGEDSAPGADRSFYPSPDATMLRRSPSGPGRRSFFGLQDVQ